MSDFNASTNPYGHRAANPPGHTMVDSKVERCAVILPPMDCRQANQTKVVACLGIEATPKNCGPKEGTHITQQKTGPLTSYTTGVHNPMWSAPAS